VDIKPVALFGVSDILEVKDVYYSYVMFVPFYYTELTELNPCV